MQVVDSQREKSRQRAHIPYRDSKLTFLLQDSLGGNAKTMVVANVSPSTACCHETLSTLQFANRVKDIRNRAKINTDTVGDMKALQAEVERLQAELSGEQVNFESLPLDRVRVAAAVALLLCCPGGRYAATTALANEKRRHSNARANHCACIDPLHQRRIA